MIVTPLHLVDPQQPRGQVHRRQTGESETRNQAGRRPFDALLASLQPLHGVGAGVMAQRVARADTFQGQFGTDARSTRLSLLQQRDADGRANGQSRISGASRSAVEPVAETTPGSAVERAQRLSGPGRRFDHASTDSSSKHITAGTSGEGRGHRATGGANQPFQPNRTFAGNDNVLASRPTRQGLTRNAHTGDNVSPVNAGVHEAAPPMPVSGAVTSPEATVTDRPRVSDTSTGQAVQVASPRGAGGADVRSGSPSDYNGAPQMRTREGLNSRGTSVKRTLQTSPKDDASQPRQLAAFDRIARVIHAKQSGQELVARIRLDPPLLGRVRINVRLSHDVLRIRLTAETAEARQTLMSQVEDLRATLERQGLRVDRVDFPAPLRGEEGSTVALRDDSTNTPAPRPEADLQEGDPGATPNHTDSHQRPTGAEPRATEEKVRSPDEANEEIMQATGSAPGQLDVRV